MTDENNLPAQLEQLRAELIDLQIQFEYQQRELHQLSDVVREQAAHLEMLTTENKRLQHQLELLEPGARSLEDERPPHY